MRLGLYGGAFNPIHRCHLVVAEAARTRLGLDVVLFIPTGDPPHKPASEFFPAEHRMEMVKLAFAPYSYFQVSNRTSRLAASQYPKPENRNTAQWQASPFPCGARLGRIRKPACVGDPPWG